MDSKQSGWTPERTEMKITLFTPTFMRLFSILYMTLVFYMLAGKVVISETISFFFFFFLLLGVHLIHIRYIQLKRSKQSNLKVL